MSGCSGQAPGVPCMFLLSLRKTVFVKYLQTSCHPKLAEVRRFLETRRVRNDQVEHGDDKNPKLGTSNSHTRGLLIVFMTVILFLDNLSL